MPKPPHSLESLSVSLFMILGDTAVRQQHHHQWTQWARRRRLRPVGEVHGCLRLVCSDEISVVTSTGMLSTKAGKACLGCHLRKVKCDAAANGHPCSRCRASNAECIISERRRRRRVPRSGPESEGQMSSGEEDDDSHLLHQESAAHDYAQSDPCSSTHLASGLQNDSQAGSIDVPPAFAGAEEGEGGSGTYSGVPAAERQLAEQHLVDFFNQDLRHSPIQARSIYVGNELCNLNFLTRPRSGERLVRHYPSANFYVPRSDDGARPPATPNLIPKDAFVMPPPGVSDALVDAYFLHVHPLFPVLDRDSFYLGYRDCRSAPSILLIQAICLVGSHVSTFDNVQALKMAFFRRAKALVDGRYDEDRMHLVQAALLMTWFSDGGDDVCANAWWWIGVAARTAIGLGSEPVFLHLPTVHGRLTVCLVHRDVTHSKMPPSDKRTWRRIWWCLVQFDALVSLSLGRPRAVDLDECDVPELTLDDFDSSITPTHAIYVMQNTKLCVIISDLLRQMFSMNARKCGVLDRGGLHRIDDALAEWSIALPHEMRQNAIHNANAGICPMLLQLTYNTALLQMHRAAIMSSETVDTTLGTVNNDGVCAEASSRILSIFQHFQSRSALTYCCFWTPSSLFAAMIQLNESPSHENRILAIAREENREAAVQALTALARHWLSAATLARLVRSFGSTKGWFSGAQSRRQGIAQDSIPQESEPHARVSSCDRHALPNIGLEVGTSAQVATPISAQDSQWMFAPPSGSVPGDFDTSVQLEANRWQNNVQEWESLYWCDPVAMLSTDDFQQSLE